MSNPFAPPGPQPQPHRDPFAQPAQGQFTSPGQGPFGQPGTGQFAQAVPQALAVSCAGYFFYLTRRVAGTNAVTLLLYGALSAATFLLPKLHHPDELPPAVAAPLEPPL